jgi:hypothetical protein
VSPAYVSRLGDGQRARGALLGAVRAGEPGDVAGRRPQLVLVLGDALQVLAAARRVVDEGALVGVGAVELPLPEVGDRSGEAAGVAGLRVEDRLEVGVDVVARGLVHHRDCLRHKGPLRPGEGAQQVEGREVVEVELVVAVVRLQRVDLHGRGEDRALARELLDPHRVPLGLGRGVAAVVEHVPHRVGEVQPRHGHVDEQRAERAVEVVLGADVAMGARVVPAVLEEEVAHRLQVAADLRAQRLVVDHVVGREQPEREAGVGVAAG